MAYLVGMEMHEHKRIQQRKKSVIDSKKPNVTFDSIYAIKILWMGFVTSRMWCFDFIVTGKQKRQQKNMEKENDEIIRSCCCVTSSKNSTLEATASVLFEFYFFFCFLLFHHFRWVRNEEMRKMGPKQPNIRNQKQEMNTRSQDNDEKCANRYTSNARCVCQWKLYLILDDFKCVQHRITMR